MNGGQIDLDVMVEKIDGEFVVLIVGVCVGAVAAWGGQRGVERTACLCLKFRVRLESANKNQNKAHSHSESGPQRHRFVVCNCG